MVDLLFVLFVVSIVSYLAYLIYTFLPERVSKTTPKSPTVRPRRQPSSPLRPLKETVQVSRRSSTTYRPAKKIYGPDRIGLVGFHDHAFYIAVPAEPNAPWLQSRSQKLHSRVGGCGTNVTDGLRKAIEMANKAPSGVIKRIWLLTDGYPNQETEQLETVVEEARRSYINVNTIGFGDQYDEALLRRIAGSTHNGKFVAVRTLRELTEALLKSERSRHGQKRKHQSETTILLIDLSPSMSGRMEDKSKVAVVEEAVLRLLHYKRECFA